MTDTSSMSLAAPLSGGACIDFGLGRRLASLAGDLWTIVPAVIDGPLGSKPVPGKPFATVVEDNLMSAVRLTGILDEPDGADSLILIVLTDDLRAALNSVELRRYPKVFLGAY